MAVDIETIGVALETTGLVAGKAALNDVGVAANKAADAADRVTASSKTLSWQNQQMTQVTKTAVGVALELGHAQEVLAKRELEAADAADKFMTRLQQQAAQAGKSRAEIVAMQAAMHGVSEGAAPYIKQIEEASKTTAGLGLQSRQTQGDLFRMFAAMTSGDMQQFGSSARQVAAQSGMMGAAFSAAGLAVLGTVATLGAFALAAYKGWEENERLQKSLVATGNYAGITADEFSFMATAAAEAAHTGIGYAKEALQELTSTGQFTGEVMHTLGETMLLQHELTGASLKDLAKDYAKMPENVSKWAVDHNQAMHFMSLAQYDHIKLLQDQGDKQGAMIVVGTALNDHLRKQEQHLSELQKAWRDLGKEANDAWNYMKGVVSPNQTEIAIRKATFAVAMAQREMAEAKASSANAATLSAIQIRLDEALTRHKIANSVAIDAQEKAAAEGKKARDEEAAINARLWTTQQLESYDKTFAMKNKLAKAQQMFDALSAVNKGLTIQQQETIIEGIEKEAETRTKATKKVVDQDAKLLASIREGMAAQEAELELGQKLTPVQAEIAKMAAAIAEGKHEYSEATIVAADALFTEKLATEALNTARELSAKQEADAAKALESHIEQVTRSVQTINDQIIKQKEHNATIGKSKEELAALVAARMLDTAAMYDQRAATLEMIDPMSELAKRLREQADAQRELAGLRLNGARLEMDNSALKELDKLLDPARAESFGDALKSAFGEAGNALARFTKVFENHAKKQAAHAKEAALAAKMSAGDERIKIEMQLADRQAKEQISYYGEMAGAAKGFFDQQSTGYKVLSGIEKAMFVARLAMQAQTMISNIASAVTGVMAGAAQMFAQSGWGGFAGVAAMLGVMGGLGFSGGSGGVGPGAADRQKSAGTGTVLGDDAAKSESISNALDALKDSAKIELQYQSGMLAALRNIESSMGGLSSLVIRTSGLTGEYQGPSQLGGRTTSNGGRILPGHSVLEKLWGSTSVSLRDQGIEFASQALADIIKDGGSIVAQAFAEIETVKKSWFGLSKKVTISTEYSALDQEIIDQFTAVVDNIVTTTQLATSALGQSAAAYDAAIASVIVDLGKVSFKDMTGEEIQEQLTNIFSSLGDDVARAAMPTTVAFQRVGEGLFETIVRVAGGVETASYALEQLGITAVAWTEVLNTQGDVGAEIVRQSILVVESLTGVKDMIQTLDGSAEDLAETYSDLLDVADSLVAVGISANALTRTLVRGAGGLDDLQSSLDAYFEDYFNDAERAAAQTRKLRQQFVEIGLTMPASVVLFRAMVDGIDDTTEAGQLLLGKVLQLAPAFKEMSDATADLASNILAARSDLQSAKDALRSYGEQLQSTSDGIVQQINTLRGQAAQALASAQATAQQALSAVATADQQARQALTSAQTALTSALRGVSSAIADAANQVLNAQQSLAQARSAITDGYLAALDQQASVRDAITDAHLAAQSELFDAQQRLTDVQEQSAQALRAAGDDILAVLRELAGTSAGTGSLAEQYRAQRNEFDALVARARGGDLEAAQQVGGAGQSLITARRATANTREQAIAEDIYVRQQLASVAAITGTSGPDTSAADAIAEAQAALTAATEKAAAAQLLAISTESSLTAATVDLAAQYAAATVEVARWSSAVAVSGASRTAEQVDILGAYNTALANLATAQASQAALLAATQGLDLSGSQLSAANWASAVDAATLAQAAYTTAQTTAASTGSDLAIALAAAAEAGLTLAAVKSPLDLFLESVTAFANAQAVATAVQADLYDSGSHLVEQYTTQGIALAAATTALGDFQLRVAGIDLSALDQLSQLDGLMADYNDALATLTALTPDPRDSAFGQQVTAAYQDILGRTPELDGLMYWIEQLANGDSDARMRERITASATYMASPEWAAQNPGAPQYGTEQWQALYGGYLTPHENGLDRVPYNNYPAMLHVDETVLNREAAAEWRASRAATPVAVAPRQGLDEESRAMMLELIVRIQNIDLRLKKFDEDGMPPERT